MAERLRTTAEEFGHQPELAQEQGLVLMSAWLQQLVAPPSMPTLIDRHSGEPIVPITDHYRVLDADALARALQGCADVDGDPLAGWSRRIECDDGQARPIASINPGKKSDQLEIFYTTQAYADQGRAWFEGLTAGFVTFLTRQSTSAESLMSQGKTPRSSATLGMSPPGIDPQELTQAMAELIQRSYANWADESIPALNNKTPRQAIHTGAGLERVKGLLRSYESGEKAQAAQQGRREISFDFLWASLGVSRESSG